MREVETEQREQPGSVAARVRNKRAGHQAGTERSQRRNDGEQRASRVQEAGSLGKTEQRAHLHAQAGRRAPWQAQGSSAVSHGSRGKPGAGREMGLGAHDHQSAVQGGRAAHHHGRDNGAMYGVYRGTMASREMGTKHRRWRNGWGRGSAGRSGQVRL
ncbi:uncharacterized protein [Zea mays]|jgi:hypothetical protein|uniref:Uncharacterized protein n=1 Tax=Zea mays TaxID=4577 RepID=C0P4Q6_MAIZE|nr:uncharacterized protein LOC100382132 [Zea mays]ACN27972.1 unknown [Zea mays]|eukprot:XP_020406184.1 uncharacterized protein LOC100382132 [Zea mays]